MKADGHSSTVFPKGYNKTPGDLDASLSVSVPYTLACEPHTVYTGIIPYLSSQARRTIRSYNGGSGEDEEAEADTPTVPEACGCEATPNPTTAHRGRAHGGKDQQPETERAASSPAAVIARDDTLSTSREAEQTIGKAFETHASLFVWDGEDEPLPHELLDLGV
ncbi:uncharacterized protein JN550_008936 [Neoarthrinium moseri]|uniref:uncharacterized protein n=1 Tax=Neoarthrinium moseri TaxID=1658444 RepID=UPI001FDE2CDD|nr:uncharacterized protein JN550_008936 [Neoarthrinium moseri]KAI1864379.1 hypothetical protein JN550_008936 [Neoarthrinium moseri]